MGDGSSSRSRGDGDKEGAARGCSQLGGGAARGGCSQCSREGLGVTQPHSLSGLRVVLEGLGSCAPRPLWDLPAR